MSPKMIPSKDEDSERAKLPALAKNFGLEFHEEGRSAWISGKDDHARVSVTVKRQRFEQDILDFSIRAPSSLVATIYHKGLLTSGSQALASILSKLGGDVYCGMQTGNEYIDKNFFVEVDAAHKPMMEALVAQEAALDLMERILRRFAQISFTGKEIHFYRFIEKGDLDLDKAKEALDWLHELDRYDGIYL